MYQRLKVCHPIALNLYESEAEQISLRFNDRVNNAFLRSIQHVALL